MPGNSDWLPTMREKQLAMGKNWVTVLNSPAAMSWNVPPNENQELSALVSTAETALAAAQSSERTPVITAQCKAAFEALLTKMRFIKSRYFLSPPLTDADFISLELKPRCRLPRLRRKRTFPAPAFTYWNCICGLFPAFLLTLTGATMAIVFITAWCRPAVQP